MIDTIYVAKLVTSKQVGLVGCVIIVVVFFWILQIVFNIADLYEPFVFGKVFNRKRDFLYWCIPILPLAISFLDKLLKLGSDKCQNK